LKSTHRRKKPKRKPTGGISVVRKKWEIVGREYHNSNQDLLVVHVTYKDGRKIENRYLVYKDEDRVPYKLMKQRKWGDSKPLDGRKWIEGNIKGKRMKPRNSRRFDP
jgi:hypothetical protein